MTQLLSVEVGDLMADPTQPRKTFRKDEQDRMQAAVAARGVLQPLRVILDSERGKYRILTGECRWRAAIAVGLSHVPCLLVEGAVSECDILSDQIVENDVRHSIRPIEFARAVSRLRALRGCNAQTLAQELGISGAELSRTERLLSLPEDIQALVDSGAVPEGIAYEIARLPDEAGQRQLAEAVAAKKMNRKAVIETVAATVPPKNVKAKDSHLSCRIDGVAVSVAADAPLTLDTLLAVFRRLLREAEGLKKNGKLASDLAARLKAS